MKYVAATKIYVTKKCLKLRGEWRRKGYEECLRSLEHGYELRDKAKELMRTLPDKDVDVMDLQTHLGRLHFLKGNVKAKITELLPVAERTLKTVERKYGKLESLKQLEPENFPSIDLEDFRELNIELDQLAGYVNPHTRRQRFMTIYKQARDEIIHMRQIDESLISASQNSQNITKKLDIRREHLERVTRDLLDNYNIRKLKIDPYHINEDLFRHANELERAVSYVQEARAATEEVVFGSLDETSLPDRFIS